MNEFIARKANVNLVDKLNNNALSEASGPGYEAIAEILKNAGATPPQTKQEKTN